MYSVCILDAAARDLEAVDRAVARRIVLRIQWLAEHVGDLRPEPLTGGLAGLFKLRVGDYRVIYELLQDEKTLVVHQIGHRRDVYRKRR